MGDYIQRLLELRDMARSGSARVADVLGKVREVVEVAERLARDVADGKVFSAGPAQDQQLHDLEADFSAVADVSFGTPPPAQDAPPAVAAVPPGMWPVIAELVIELIRSWRQQA